MRYTGGKTLLTQTTMFDEVHWADTVVSPSTRDLDVRVEGEPPGASAGLLATSVERLAGQPPFWEFTYRIDSSKGLVITGVVARGTQPSTGGPLSEEKVFEKIDFTDLFVTFDDGSPPVPFDIGRAFANLHTFEFNRNGERFTVDPPDRLFQYGIRLTLRDNVLAGTGTCWVTLELIIVFRGATNDFDPGGVPVAMGCYPQIAWTWDAKGSTNRVTRFRASVRITVDNVMYGAHSEHGHHGTSASNVAALYTDSNTSMDYLGRWSFVLSPLELAVFNSRADLYGLEAMTGRLARAPASWGMLFDYLYANFTLEKEFVAVHGPEDGSRHYRASTDPPRRANYVWPVTATHEQYNAFVVEKVNRQGQYDNVHIHADMGVDRYGNSQIHAPFCGHSCVHMHWRWSAIAGGGAISGRVWHYNGWSFTTKFGFGAAHSTPGAPLVAPNQRVKIAVCDPKRTRHSPDHVIDPQAPSSLPVRNKMIWYCADIYAPPAGSKQVVCEHGLGWAYRYAMPEESLGVRIVTAPGFLRGSSEVGPATQADVSRFFAERIYPFMRYYTDRAGARVNQIPDGGYYRTHVWGSDAPAPAVKVEDL